MRTNYPLDKIVRRKNEGRRRLFFSLAVIGVVALFLIFSQSVRVMVNKIFITITRPLWVMEGDALVLGGDMFKFLRLQKSLVEENRRLKEDVFRLNAEVAAQDILAEDYDRLAALVGRFGANSDNDVPILGRVILKPNRSPYDMVVVDVGAKNTRSVKVGNVARLTKDLTVGKVVAVTDNTATIELFSSPGVVVGVLVGSDRIAATSTGRGGGNMLIELPRGLMVDNGDAVVLPTIKNESIGFIGGAINDPTEPSQSLLATLPVNIFHLSWLEIYEE